MPMPSCVILLVINPFFHISDPYLSTAAGIQGYEGKTEDHWKCW